MCQLLFDNIFVVQLHNAVAEMEKEKFNIQKKHTEDMQELLEDTNARLSKMEEDYLEQIKSTVSFLLVCDNRKRVFLSNWILCICAEVYVNTVGLRNAMILSWERTVTGQLVQWKIFATGNEHWSAALQWVLHR